MAARAPVEPAFTARVDELERAHGVRAAAEEAGEARIGVVFGEVGIGKTRFLDEVCERERAGGSVVLRMRCFNGAPSSFGPMIASAIESTEASTLVPGSSLGGELAMAIDALLRIVRLRRTCIALDDVHHLSADGAQQLATLVEAVEDHPVAVFVTTRPSPRVANGVLERFVHETIELQELDRRATMELVERSTGGVVDQGLADTIFAATHGNPQALRVALRSALASGLLRVAAGRLVADAPIDVVADALRESVAALADGMLVAVPVADRLRLAMVAMLGELFSREAAASLLADDLGDAMSLLCVRAPGAPAPLAGTRRSLPFAFTDTLAHRALVAEARVDVDRLVDVLIGDHALYSPLPFVLLATHAQKRSLEAATLERLVARGAEAVYALDNSPGWEQGMALCDALDQLVEHAGESVGDERKRRLRAGIVNRRLSLLRRAATGDEFRRYADELLELTADPTTVGDAELRLAALAHLHRPMRCDDYGAWRAYSEEVARLADSYPDLVGTRGYVNYLLIVARLASITHDRDVIDAVDTSYDALQARDDIPEEVRALAGRLVPAAMLPVFETEGELERRREALGMLEESAEPGDLSLRMQRALLHEASGDVGRLLADIDDTIRRAQRNGLGEVWRMLRLAALVGHAAHGMPLEWMASEASSTLSSASEAVRLRLEPERARRVAMVGVLCGEAIASESSDDRRAPHPIVRLEHLVDLHKELARRHRDGEKPAAADARDLAARIDCALEWIASRSLVAFGRPLITRAGSLLPKREATAWRARFDELATTIATTDASEHRVSISMFGSIRATDAAGTELRLQGARSKTLLALMVADRMLREPLDAQEFARIAIGDDDPFKARRALPVAVFRLREIIGQETISTDGENPRLVDRAVAVDLLDAHEALLDVERALGSRSLVGARMALRRALSAADGELPFPGLYDEFFERAREEFENRVRSATLSVARALVREGDPIEAAELVRMALSAIDGDEDLRALLVEALASGGRVVDAHRARMAVDE
jgi:hypothetical protein